MGCRQEAGKSENTCVKQKLYNIQSTFFSRDEIRSYYKMVSWRRDKLYFWELATSCLLFPKDSVPSRKRAEK